MNFKSTNNLDFEVAYGYRALINDGNNWTKFRVGTCEGLFCAKEKTYDILAIVNNDPGNGHLTDVIEWFQQSCKRDKKSLRFLEIMNKKFKEKLIKKYGFKPDGKDNLIIKP